MNLPSPNSIWWGVCVLGCLLNCFSSAMCLLKLSTYIFLQLFRILLGINVRVLVVLLLLGFGAIFYVGARTSPIIVFVISVCILSFLVAIYLMKWVLAKDEGPPEMVQVNLFPMFWWVFSLTAIWKVLSRASLNHMRLKICWELCI